jgi:hypothetical protein
MSGLSALGGALGGAASGFIAGRQLRDQEQVEQARIQQQQFDNAQTALPYYQQIARENPALAGTEAFAAAVNKHVAPLGVNFGKTLPDTFGHVDVSDLIKDPTALQSLSSLSPALKEALRPALGDQLGKDWYSQPGRPTPQEAIANDRDYTTQLTQYYNGNVAWDANARALRAQQDYNRQFLPGYAGPPIQPPGSTAPTDTSEASNMAIPPAGSAPAGPAAAPDPQMGWKGTTAQQRADSGTANATTHQKVGVATVKHLDAETTHENIVDKYLPEKEQTDIAGKVAQTALANERRIVLPAQVEAATTRANAAATAADTGQKHLAMAMADFKANGGRTDAGVAAYTGLVNSLQAQANLEKTAADSASSAMQTMLRSNNGKIPTKGLEQTWFQGYQEIFNNRNKRYNTLIGITQKMAIGKAGYAKSLLQKNGAPASMRPQSLNPASEQKVSQAVKAATDAHLNRKTIIPMFADKGLKTPYSQAEKAAILQQLPPG